MKSRVVLLVLFFVLLFGAVIARIFYLQILPNQALERLKKNQYTTMVQLPSQRGKILDRREEELATSVASQSLYADPGMIKAPRHLARQLAKILGLNFKELYLQFSSDKRFVWVKRHVDPDLVQEIKDMNEPGLRFVEEGRRAYPNQSLLAPVLGFVGSDGNGLEGLEKKYDSELRGEKRSIMSRRDARGRPLVVSGQIFEIQADGATIETTIDKDLQYELEHELEKVTGEQRAEGAMGVIMDPATGEILAMGSYPSFDPALGGKANPDHRRNKVVTDIFEPGSTFKVVTVAAALRSGKIKPNTKFFCENGKFKIGKYTIHEAETSHGHEWLTLSEILQYSSNIGTTKVAFELGEDAMKAMIRNFGFFDKTGIDFPGEAGSLINAMPKWPEIVLSNVSFGHGIGVTAIQMANVYSAIANGGHLMKPYLVKRVIDSDGHVLDERKPQIIRDVLSEKEDSMLTLMLSTVTEEGGTGTLARVDGYPVAGKTGTAQKVKTGGRGYVHNAYISSFAGFVPANNPQFTIYVVVNNPRKEFYGAQVAAPLFNHLASFALHQKGFMPIVVQDDGGNGSERAAGNNAVHGSSTTDAKNSRPIAAIPDNDLVPNFSGLTVREAARVLKSQEGGEKKWGDVQLLGTGVASGQWPPAGAHWNKQKLKVIFKPAG
jgi:cell division protein FtsI (penicillin-binding protein 3)